MTKIKSTHPAVLNAAMKLRTGSAGKALAEAFEKEYKCKVHIDEYRVGVDYVSFETEAELTMFLLKYGK